MERTQENKLQGKKSLILYLDQLEILNELSDSEAGKLFKAIQHFVFTGEDLPLDKLVRLVYVPIKLQLRRDLEKWRNIKVSRSVAGSKGGRPKKAKEANAFLIKQTKAKKAVSVNVNVNVNVINTIKEIWNDFAKENNLSPIITVSGVRRTAIIQRSKEKDFDLNAILRKIETSPFLLGDNERGWKINFDYLFCSKTKYLKILEGNYDNKQITREEKNQHVANEIIGSINNTNQDNELTCFPI